VRKKKNFIHDMNFENTSNTETKNNENNNNNNNNHLYWIAGAIAIGAATPIALGATATSLVPTAMTAFGTVVPGVGTLHAPLASWGLAAVLQSAGTTLVTTISAAIGGVAGGAVVGALGWVWPLKGNRGSVKAQ
jgi:hypothetical protein